MDIQYVLDPYSCVSYIVSYISKGQRRLPNLLRDACNEARELDSDIRQQVRRIGNQFLSSVEIGAQEAVYLTLQMPLRRSTRLVVFVDTNRPDARTSLIKPLNELKQLPATSKNIEMDNTLKRYKRRPKVLQKLCYAEFASWYDLCKVGKVGSYVEQSTEQELPELDYEHDEDDDLVAPDENDDHAHGRVVEFPCGTRIRRRLRQKIIYSHITPINHDREEHFREKIMLYTHWRDEEKDIIGEFDSFEQSYYAKLEEVNRNKSLYQMNDDAFYEGINEDIEAEDVESVIHPEAQHEDLIDTEVGPSTSAAFGCFDPGVGPGVPEGYDLGEDLGVSRRRVDTGDLPHREMNTEPYLQRVRSLNTEQKTLFYHILHKVKTNCLPFYTFMTGGAGCGKSAVIGAIYQALIKYFNHVQTEDPDTEKVLLCAPTGKAAHNIGGKTVHSAFCIPANQGFQFKPLDMQQLNTMRARYRDLKVVIIDEISMVGQRMFNFINLRLQEVKGCSRSFGNVSVLAVGDLFQLRPVHDTWIFSQVYEFSHLQCLGTNLWMHLFDFFELREVMRQKDDHAYAMLLNRLREGQHTEEDLAVLEGRQVKRLGISAGSIKDLPHLFCRRADVYAHNDIALSAIPSSSIINIEAVDTVSGNVNTSVHKNILSRIPLDTNKTMGLQKNLELGIGSPCELCANVDTADGLTNGASCYIRKFDFRVENSARCSIVWVEFDDKSIGKNWRFKYSHLYQEGLPLSWTPVLEICRRFIYKYYKTYQIIRRQFPLVISSGKTIRKAQGSTIEKAVMHFGRRKIDHVHYVGLSRVTSLSGVHILKLNSAKISVSLDVQEEMERLREHKQITSDLVDLGHSLNGSLTVCFQNCRSLRKHIEDIKHEHNLLRADIIGLVETRVSGSFSDAYQIDGFTALCSNPEQSAHGITIYHKSELDVQHHVMRSASNIEYALIALPPDVVIGIVYCPPKFATVAAFSAFLSAIDHDISKHFIQLPLQQTKLVLMGDFNYDYLETCAKAQFFSCKLSLRQLVTSITTDYGSCLDHIYTNLPQQRLVRLGTLESYFSDHKPIFLEFSVNR